MKKGTWVFMIVLMLTVGGIKTAHAYSKKKSGNQQDNITIKVKPITSNSKELVETTETSERKQAESKKTQPSKTENSSVANVVASPPSEVDTHDLSLETPTHKDDVIIEEVYENIVEDTIQETIPVEQSNQENFSGVSYLGYDYELGYFSGFDYLPPWTNMVYQWTNFPNHYLVEKASYPGQTIFGLQIGSTVVIEGVSYKVYDIVYNHPNNQEALDMVLYSGAAASMQVCVSLDDDADLNLYFLR